MSNQQAEERQRYIGTGYLIEPYDDVDPQEFLRIAVENTFPLSRGHTNTGEDGRQHTAYLFLMEHDSRAVWQLEDIGEIKRCQPVWFVDALTDPGFDRDVLRQEGGTFYYYEYFGGFAAMYVFESKEAAESAAIKALR